MQYQNCFAAVNRTFCDLLKINQLFKGISMILKKNFAQISPVIPNGSKAATVMVNIRN
jgi:hypothetical protein